jgi:hypothetical protein
MAVMLIYLLPILQTPEQDEQQQDKHGGGKDIAISRVTTIFAAAMLSLSLLVLLRLA